MNVGYFSVNENSKTDFIKWDLLEEQKIISETKYFKHIAFEKPFTVLMNGKTRKSVIVTDL